VKRLRLAAAAVLLAAAVAGCADSAAFRQPDAVEIVEPHDRAEVTLPVSVRWRSDLDGGAAGDPYFAVFVDQAPIRPGQSLRVLADESCNRTKGCPDLQYLRDRYVYVTDETQVTLDVVPRKDSSQRTGARDTHEATIVVLDADGRRVGEAAYAVEFEVGDT
jgi:hypothetical protein